MENVSHIVCLLLQIRDDSVDFLQKNVRQNYGGGSNIASSVSLMTPI